jgi:hypothetical protein
MPSSSFHDMVEQACQVLALSFSNLLISKRVILFNMSSETKKPQNRTRASEKKTCSKHFFF